MPIVWIDDLHQSVQSVVEIRRRVIQRIGRRFDVSVVVITQLRKLILCADILIQAIQAIEHSAAGLHQVTQRIINLFGGAIAQQVQRVTNPVAQAILHAGHAMGSIVTIGNKRAVGQGHFSDLPKSVIFISSDQAADVFATLTSLAGNSPLW